jgi:hypothetical protein
MISNCQLEFLTIIPLYVHFIYISIPVVNGPETIITKSLSSNTIEVFSTTEKEPAC